MKDQKIDTGEVTLGGSWAAPSVADAATDALVEAKANDIELIAAHLEHDEIDVNGLPTDEWYAKSAAVPRSQEGHVRAIKRTAHRIQAIRQEIADREQAEKEATELRRKQARKTLEQVVCESPTRAAEVVEKAEEVAAAYKRVKVFIRDLQLLGGGRNLRDIYKAIEDGTRLAAAELGVDMPKLPELPIGTPFAKEIDGVFAIIHGRHGGFDKVVAASGDYKKVEKIKRELN